MTEFRVFITQMQILALLGCKIGSTFRERTRIVTFPFKQMKSKKGTWMLKYLVLGTSPEGESTFCHSPAEFATIFWADGQKEGITNH